MHRLSLGFESPNHFAAIVAAMIPFVFVCPAIFRLGMTGGSVWKLCVCLWAVATVALWLTLAKTYSRGGVIAALTAIAFCLGLLLTAKNGVSMKDVYISILYNTCIALISIYGFSVATRFEAVLHGDESAWNRVPLWRGALQLIGASTGRGWGSGASGMAYVHWIQDPEAPMRYGSMVNTYLTIAVEYGVAKFCLGASAIASVYFSGLVTLANLPIRRRVVQTACLGSLTAILASAFFSTLHKNYLISIILSVILIGSTLISLFSITRGQLRNAVMISVCGGGILYFTVQSTGRYINDHACLNVHLNPDGGVSLTNSRNSDYSNHSAVILADNVTFGVFPGRVIRQFLKLNMAYGKVTVYPANAQPTRLDVNTIIVLGDRVSTLPPMSSQCGLFLVAPETLDAAFPNVKCICAYVPEIADFPYAIRRSLGFPATWSLRIMHGSGHIMTHNAVSILKECLGMTLSPAPS